MLILKSRQEGKVGAVGWIVAFVVIAVSVAGLVGGTVLHPILYGLFIAAVLVVPLWLCSSAVEGLIGSIFGKRR